MNRDLELKTSKWKVRCVYVIDRYTIEIHRYDGSQWQPLLTTPLGDTTDDWPCNPPLQQISYEELGQASPAILGMGMAGTSHWSLSIHEDRDQSLVVDVACRYSNLPRSLELTFQHAATADTFARNGDLVELSVGTHRIEFTPGADTNLHLANDLLIARPNAIPAPRATARWLLTLK
ncbi:MAG: hypothetical protein U0905_09425 [Pirellulales bacterium]